MIKKKSNTLGQELLSDFKFYSSYSKFNQELNKYESWDDSVNRVFDEMHAIKFKDVLKTNTKFNAYYEFAKKQYKEKYILGSQRALQFGGEPILKHNAKMFNCVSLYCDRVPFFQDTMYWLLCGCGVGFSVQNKHVEKLPKIKKRSNRSKVHLIEDSIEGWADAIGVLLSSYFENDVTFPKYQNCHISFDYSEIRPKGSLISGGFKAPGADGLRSAIQKIEELIDRVLDSPDFDGTVESIVAYDIVMHMSDAVLSGGVRRSATICLFSPDDEKMIKAKIGDWFIKNPQRARSNNSVLLNKNTLTRKEFSKYFAYLKEFGEPGFGFTENEDIIYNPCVSSDTWVMTSLGAKQVKDLIGIKFKAVIDGKEYDSISNGFWKTGDKLTYKLKTDKGYELKLTNNHKLLVNNGSGKFWKELSEINIGDRITLNNNSNNYSWGSKDEKEYEKAWLLGNLIGDGTFVENTAILRYWNNENSEKSAIKYLENNFKTYKEFTGSKYKNVISISSSKLLKFSKQFNVDINNKTPNTLIEEQSSKFYEGFIAGLIDADGSIQGTQKKGVSIRLTQSNERLLLIVQRMLLRLGIVSKLYIGRNPEGNRLLPDSNKVLKEYYCKRTDELIISKSNMIIFRDRINLQFNEKQNKLNNLLSSYKRKVSSENFVDKVLSINQCDIEPVYDVTIDDVHCFDANGIIAHNCFEIAMKPQTESGVSGSQGCNLVEINGNKCRTEEEFYEACRAAAIIGTMQAAYTDFKYVDDVTKEIFEREALLGCSITGFMNNPQILLNPAIQRNGAEIIKRINKEVAKMIGIRQAARTTCGKPSGNASVLLKTASGIHGEHHPQYIRNVQVNKDEDVGKELFKVNPKMFDESVWSANGTDWVVSFPIEVNGNSIYKDELLGTKLLDYVKLTMENWVEYGTNVELCTDPTMRHNVSNTVIVDDWDEVEKYIYDNKKIFSGISLLPLTGDKDYNQAPFISILTPKEFIKKYGDATLFASGLIVDGLSAFNNNLWLACDTVMGIGEKLEFTDDEVLEKIKNTTPRELWENLGFKNSTLEKLSELHIKPELEEYKRYMDSNLITKIHNYPIKSDWIRRAKQFSERYFDSIKDMTYCLKDVNNYHKWIEINRDIQDVDWESLNMKPKYLEIDTTGAVACSGGACEIV